MQTRAVGVQTGAWGGIVVVLVLAGMCALVWMAALDRTGGELAVAFLDIGQGDAIFIETPEGVQVLIDGGSSGSVLRALGERMLWFDRSIDAVVATHPDRDHIGGLVPVLERFDVAHVVHTGALADEPDDEAFARALEAAVARGAHEHLAERGMLIDLGSGTYIEVLFPDRQMPAGDANDASIVARLVYGDTTFLFTGDAPDEIEEYLVSLDGARLESDVLKAGHHGSRTSSAPLFVGFTGAEHAVISRGCDNSYGHPHTEVLETLARFDIQVHDTCEDGTAVFTSDGTRVEHVR